MTILLRRTIRDHLRRTRPEKNPQRIPANTPPVFPGLRPRIWPHLLRLVTNGNIGQAPGLNHRRSLHIHDLILMLIHRHSQLDEQAAGWMGRHSSSGTGSVWFLLQVLQLHISKHPRIIIIIWKNRLAAPSNDGTCFALCSIVFIFCPHHARSRANQNQRKPCQSL